MFVVRLLCDLCGSAGPLVEKIARAMLSALVRRPSQMRASVCVNGLRTAISVTGVAKPCGLPREIVREVRGHLSPIVSRWREMRKVAQIRLKLGQRAVESRNLVARWRRCGRRCGCCGSSCGSRRTSSQRLVRPSLGR